MYHAIFVYLLVALSIVLGPYELVHMYTCHLCVRVGSPEDYAKFLRREMLALHNVLCFLVEVGSPVKHISLW